MGDQREAGVEGGMNSYILGAPYHFSRYICKCIVHITNVAIVSELLFYLLIYVLKLVISHQRWGQAKHSSGKLVWFSEADLSRAEESSLYVSIPFLSL